MDSPILFAYLGLYGCLMVLHVLWDEWRHPATSFTSRVR